MKSIRRIALLSLSGLLTACSHDAKRENPLDPELTPAVQLSVAVNDSLGQSTLTWSAYEGDSDFAVYWLLRRASGLVAVDTLAAFDDPQITTFTDTTPAHGLGYSYRVSVVNQVGHEVTSQTREARALSFPPIQITGAEFASHAATASISWTPYRGPRFLRYELLRSANGSREVVAELYDFTSHVFIDSFLVGNQTYAYQVNVVTTRDERVESNTAEGVLHELVGSWPLDFDTGPAREGNVRLYARDGRIETLLSDRGQATLILSSIDGTVLDEQRLLDLESGIHTGRSVSSTISDAGERYLSMIGQTGSLVAGDRPESFGLLGFNAAGGPVLSEQEVFVEELGRLKDAARFTGSILIGTHSLSSAYFDDVVVAKGSAVLFEESFTDFPEITDRGDTQNGWLIWDVGPARVVGSRSRLRFQSGWAEYLEPSWQDFRLEVEVSPLSGVAGIGIGAIDYLSLEFNLAHQNLQLGWNVGGAGLEALVDTFSAPYPTIPGVPYRLNLETTQGRVRAIIKSPVRWRGESQEAVTWANLAAIDGVTTLIVDDQPYLIEASGQGRALAALASWASEVRSWEDPQGVAGAAIGVCLPDANQVQLTRPLRARSSRWPTLLTRSLGPFLGDRGGALSYPLSFDVGPDGRTYVLDAGNSRVVVFDAEDRYLTEWGGRGSGPGQFDLGDGAPLRDRGFNFAGSIAVDDEGFIYVADMGNRRMQKFSP